MTIRRAPLLAAICLLGAGGWSWWRLADAETAHAVANERRQRIHAAAERLRHSSTSTTLLTEPPSDTELLAQLQQSFAQAGLSAQAFNGIVPKPGQAQAGQQTSAQQVRLVGLRPGDIGAWCAAWIARQPAWRITDLQITHAGSADSGDDRFDCSVTLSANVAAPRP